MIKQLEQYKVKGDHIFPSQNINPKLKKDVSYGIAFCEAFLSEYVTNKCDAPYEDDVSQYSIATLRKYATGNEGNDTVKKNFFGEKKKNPETGKYPTTINVSWDGMDVMPKVFDVIRAMNQKIDYVVSARCIDPTSLKAKELDRALLKFVIDVNTKSFLERAKYRPSTPISIEDIGAESEADVDLYFDSGAYITQREIASEAACLKTKRESDHKVIEDQCFDDLITIGRTAVRNYIDKSTNTVKQRWVDWENLIVPKTSMRDFRNVTRVAEIRVMNIGELKELFHEITPAQWLVIAKQFAYMNPEYRAATEQVGYFSTNRLTQESAMYGIDPVNACNILVMDAQWLTMDTESYVENTRRYPHVFKPVDFSFEAKLRGDKVVKKKIIKKYEAMWIVGTKVMLKYGVCDDRIYYGPDGNKTPRLDFFMIKTGNKSLVERCIPHIEDIHLAAVKRRNAIATLPPGPRMIIQQQLMDNVFLNGIRQQPEDLYQKFIEKGYLVVNNLDDFNKPIFQNSRPIDFVPSGVLDDIVFFTNEITQGIERVREVTGLNQAVDASSPDSYAGLGKYQMAAASANNALAPTFLSYTILHNQSFEDVIKKWQIVVKKNKGVKMNYMPLGSTTAQILEVGEDFSNSDFNIYTQVQYTEDEKQRLLASILELNKAYTSTGGAAGLSTAEYMHIEDLIMAGSFKFAKYTIARVERKKELAAERAKRESEMLTFENQRRSLELNNQYKLDAIKEEERKKLVTARVTEAEKRKTKLYDVLAQSQSDPAAVINVNMVQQMIANVDQEINNILAMDMMVDQQSQAGGQQNMQQVA